MKPYQALAILLALYIFAAWLDQATLADDNERAQTAYTYAKGE